MSGNNIFFVVVKDVNTDHYCRVGSGNHTIRTIVHADPIRAPSLGIVQILAPIEQDRIADTPDCDTVAATV